MLAFGVVALVAGVVFAVQAGIAWSDRAEYSHEPHPRVDGVLVARDRAPAYTLRVATANGVRALEFPRSTTVFDAAPQGAPVTVEMWRGRGVGLWVRGEHADTIAAPRIAARQQTGLAAMGLGLGIVGCGLFVLELLRRRHRPAAEAVLVAALFAGFFGMLAGWCVAADPLLSTAVARDGLAASVAAAIFLGGLLGVLSYRRGKSGSLQHAG
jgi:hypothetical protein